MRYFPHNKIISAYTIEKDPDTINGSFFIASVEHPNGNGGMLVMGWLISIVSGILMSVQGVFNSEVTKQTSVWMSAAFVQITAFVVCMAAWYITGRKAGVADLLSVEPKYLLTGGILGAFITFTVIVGMSSLGPAKAVMLIVCAQLVSAYVIELFGAFGVEKQSFQWEKFWAVLLMVAGFWLFKRN